MERKFLHDLSTPLAALQMNLESLTEDVKAGAADDPDTIKRLEKCVDIMTRVSEMIAARKAEVKKGSAA